jgi:hypothetical protein
MGWELTLTPVAVALGIGMAARLGRIVSNGNKAFDPQGVAMLLGWVNNLKESERRLAVDRMPRWAPPSWTTP